MTPDRLVGPSVDLLVCGFENEKVVLLMFWEMLLMTPDKTNLLYVFCFLFQFIHNLLGFKGRLP